MNHDSPSSAPIGGGVPAPHLCAFQEHFFEARRVFELFREHRDPAMLLRAFEEVEAGELEAALVEVETPLTRLFDAIRNDVRAAMVEHAASLLRAGGARSPTGHKLIRDDEIVYAMQREYMLLRHLQKLPDATMAPSAIASHVRARIARQTKAHVSAVYRAWEEGFLGTDPDKQLWRNLIADVEDRGRKLRQAADATKQTSAKGRGWKDRPLDFSKRSKR